MIMEKFFEFLKRFDRYIQQRQKKDRAILFLKISQGMDWVITYLLWSLWVVFLPANTTSRLQPMDASIIDSQKRRYYTVNYSRTLEYVDNSSGNIYELISSWS